MSELMEYTRVQREVRRRIVRGIYAPGSRLPNFAEMGREFRVGQATIQKSIEQLNLDGYVRTVHRGGTFVADHPPHLSTIAFVEHWYGQESLFNVTLRRAADAVARESNWRFRRYTPSGHTEHRDEVVRLSNDAANHRFGGIFFTTPPFEEYGAATLNEPGIPRVSISPEPLGNIPAIGPDYDAFEQMAIADLRARGRRRIAHLLADSSHINQPAKIETLRQLDPDLRLHLVQWVSNARSASSVIHLMMHLSTADRPDALIIHDDNLVEPAIAGLLLAGVRLPDDLDVIAHANFPLATPSTMPIRRLGFDAGEIIRTGLQLLDAQRRGEPLESMLTRVRPQFATSTPVPTTV